MYVRKHVKSGGRGGRPDAELTLLVAYRWTLPYFYPETKNEGDGNSCVCKSWRTVWAIEETVLVNATCIFSFHESSSRVYPYVCRAPYITPRRVTYIRPTKHCWLRARDPRSEDTLVHPPLAHIAKLARPRLTGLDAVASGAILFVPSSLRPLVGLTFCRKVFHWPQLFVHA